MENKKIYTVINYYSGEEAFINRCGDYISGVPAKLVVNSTDNVDEAIHLYADGLLESNDNEMTLLINGIDIYNTNVNLTKEEFNLYELEIDKVIEKARDLFYQKKEKIE